MHTPNLVRAHPVLILGPTGEDPVLRQRHTLTVLAWHNIESTWCFPARPGAGTRGFWKQLRLLRRLTTVVPLHWALERMQQGRPLPPRALALTFDDGYRDNLTIAGPMLSQLRLPATCFLVPGILSGTTTPWWEKLAWTLQSTQKDRISWRGKSLQLLSPAARHSAFQYISRDLKTINLAGRSLQVEALVEALTPTGSYRTDSHFLGWEEARKLSGHMALGSHSMYHAILSREDDASQLADLSESRRQLADHLGIDAKVVAYPNGKKCDFNAATIAAAKAAGFQYAITTEPGVNGPTTPPYEIRRWLIRPDAGVVNLAKVLRDLGATAMQRRRE
jgi:peptidoglycan/xylan/chitin deacetylase (PgdA/CDA1 family)